MDRRPRLLPAPDSEPGLAEASDDDLMTLAQAGRRDAFAVLVERHAGRVFALCHRYVWDRQLALELAQDTWAQVFEQRERYRPQGQFVVWLITAARNRCRNHLRHRAIALRHRQQPDAATDHDPGMPIDVLLAAERRRRVERALARLALPLREALLLRYEHELRYEQMSQILRVPEATLRSRVHQALKLLHRWLETNP